MGFMDMVLGNAVVRQRHLQGLRWKVDREAHRGEDERRVLERRIESLERDVAELTALRRTRTSAGDDPRPT